MKTLIINGRVIDPETKLDSIKNILISKGKIQKIDEEDHEADVVIDAQNCIVTPGFIDIHMHEDLENETTIAESMLKMGVTSAIGGNCGVSKTNPREYLKKINSGYPINLGLMLGHSYLRNTWSKADKYSPVTNEELAKMSQSAAEILEGGLFGISYGIRYIPGITRKELLEISKACVKDGKIISAHVRDDAENIFESTKEIIEIAKELKIPVQNSHIGSMGGYGQMERLLKYIDEERNMGVEITSDCYPYNAFCTGIKESTFDEGFLERYNIGYDSLEIAGGKYRGQRCTEEIFKELRKGEENSLTIGHVMKSEDIEKALLDENVMIASDGILENGEGHPRASGTFPRFIKNYIKTSKLSLLEGINKISTLPAKKLRLDTKGRIQFGMDADITIFSLEEIEDRATFENPLAEPLGVKYVFIAGQMALKDGKIINPGLGRALVDKI